MTHHHNNKTVAILATDGFEQVELTSPRETLQQAGATVHIIAPDKETITGWQHTDWGDVFNVDVPLAQVSADNYDALVLPGGVLNPDRLRRNEDVLTFVRRFFKQQKPVAAICHGAQTLIDAGVVHGRRLTSYWAIQQDLKNAGADWEDSEVVEDKGLITSRCPDDLDAFNQTLLRALSRQTATA